MMGLFYDNYQNTYNPVTNNKLNINAISGTLVKTYKDSFIVMFAKNSPMEHFYLDDIQPRKIIEDDASFPDCDEKYKGVHYKLQDIVVLQVMLMSNDNYLVEAINKDKFDAMFETRDDNVGCDSDE